MRNRRVIVPWDDTDSHGYYTTTLNEVEENEDIDLKKFMFIASHNCSGTAIETKVVDNNEKLAYYVFYDRVQMTKNGKMYSRGKLTEYLVYDKATGKVKLSPAHQNVRRALMDTYFNHVNIIENLKIKLTPTLCKKIIEGSISTLYDFVKYARSYVYKKKDISLDAVYAFIVLGNPYLMNIVEDPESVLDVDKDLVHIDYNITNLQLFKCKLSELGSLKQRYNEWYKEQMHKLITISRHRDEEVRLGPIPCSPF